MGALLDELACLTRDFMVMKSAPKEGISMLSGVATDREVEVLADRFSNGELVRMLGLIQQTVAGFTRSTSRRMDTELCIVSMCQPELEINAEAMNARLTRLEDQIRSGAISAQAVPAKVDSEPLDEDLPPVHDDADAPPVFEETVVNEMPVGFWIDLAAEIRKEMKPPLVGFFATTPNSPVQGVLQGNTLVLLCSNAFTMDMINKPEILSMIAQKASGKLGSQVKVTVADKNARPVNNQQMEQLLQFGRDHGDVIKIK